MSAAEPTTITAWLVHWAERQPDKVAFRTVDEHGETTGALTYAALDSSARLLAGGLGAARGERVLLGYTSGLDFVVAFFGCLYAGAVPVPVVPPRRGKVRSSTLSVAEVCGPRFGLTRSDVLPSFSAALGDAVACDTVQQLLERGRAVSPLGGTPDGLAFLQFTSGSTSSPKGVMVSHGNLLTNLEMLRRGTAAGRESVFVCWLPLFHDMGLVWNVLEPVYLGAEAVLLEPMTFVHRPSSWLEAISRYRGCISGAPNFAYDLLVERFQPEQAKGLDLSTWRFAYNAAEPVRPETIEAFAAKYAPSGFDVRSVHPGYGMAEATLMITTGPSGRGTVVVPISRMKMLERRVGPAADEADALRVVSYDVGPSEQRLKIVDPESRVALPPGHVGEIWIAGPHVAQGYYRNEDATNETFRASIADAQDGPYLRTGDLGAIYEGALHLIGRCKDVLIIRGQNHYPQDIEHTVERAHPCLRRNFSAVFLAGTEHEARLVATVEVDDGAPGPIVLDDVEGSVRQAVVTEHDLQISEIVLLRKGTLAKTSSGKVRRSMMRQLYLNNELIRWAQEESGHARGP